MKMRVRGRLLASAALLCLVAVPAVAQENTAPRQSPAQPREEQSSEQDIIVTAERRAERVEDLPIAISAYSQATLEERNITNVGGLQFLAPSVQVGSPFQGFAQVNIRGVGSSFFGIAAEGAAAVSQDNIGLVSMQMFNSDFLDVNRVEVLRGPQGTLGGRLATAGAINIHSQRPAETFEGSLKATFGSFDRIGIEGTLSGPLAGDVLLGRLAVRSHRDEGWLRNTMLDEKLDAVDKLQVRGSLLLKPSPTFEAFLVLDYNRDRSNSIYQYNIGRARPDAPSADELWPSPGFNREDRTIALDQRTDSDGERILTALNMKWELGPGLTLSSITGYVDYERSQFWDNDGTSQPVIVQNYTVKPTFDIWQFSQEFTLAAELSSRLDMLVGAYYLRSDTRNRSGGGRPLLGVPLNTLENRLGLELSSWAAFTQWRYRLTNTLRLTAGVRYTEDSKTFTDVRLTSGAITSSGTASHTWTVATPRFSIDYAPNDDLTIYATVSRGFKPGGWNTVTDRFNPENVWNYETGIKAEVAPRVFATATGFYMKNTNLQQLVSGLDPSDPTRSFTINANSATIKGIELELDATLGDHFRLRGSGTWLDANYDELRTRDPLYPELGVQDLSGNRVVRAPKWQFNLSGEYRTPLTSNVNATASLSYTWQDQIFFDFYNNPALSQGAYGLLNLFAGVETSDGAWQLSGFINNLTDEEYYTRLQVSTLGASRTVQALPASRPRTFGVSLAYRF